MGMAVGMPEVKEPPPAVEFAKNPLAETHEFRQACSVCFVKHGEGSFGNVESCTLHVSAGFILRFPALTGPDVLDYTFYQSLEHKCRKDILVGRMKHTITWKLIRPRPTKTLYAGPYYICKGNINAVKSCDEMHRWCFNGVLTCVAAEVAAGQSCMYPGHCTFAYCQEEIDVWTLERKGFISRELLFDPFGSNGNIRLSVAKILQEHRGIFMFLCGVSVALRSLFEVASDQLAAILQPLQFTDANEKSVSIPLYTRCISNDSLWL